MALRDSNLNTEGSQPGRGVVAGLFQEDCGLEQAITELKRSRLSDNRSGMSRSETTCTASQSTSTSTLSAPRGKGRAMWEKIKTTFTCHDYTKDLDARYTSSEGSIGSLSGM